MCGITGFLNINGQPAETLILQKMSRAITHRGPNSEGLWSNEAVGLAHRRLSIIDLSPQGHQPMITENGRYVIVYNGEVYNYQELRLELEALGVAFHSRTDTEVVLKAFAEWGTSILTRLNGMFAFTIWDNETKELFIARDRYGIKPLYYTFLNQTFIFGSEIKAILAHKNAKAQIDLAGLTEYMVFQNFLSDRTLFKGIRLLPPGCSMWVKADGTFNIERYWDFSFQENPLLIKTEEYEEELDHLFRQAVNRQLIGDVAVGSYLSGGMDSGSITALAANQFPNLKTFTVGFDLHSISGLELAFDERSTAEYMSYVFKTEHYEMVLKAGDLERCMKKLVWHLEEPRVGQSYPNYYASKLASKFVKVVLAGTGGDELFGGYPWRYYRAVVNNDFDHYIEKYYGFWQRLIPDHALETVLAPVWKEVKHISPFEIFKDVFKHHAENLNKPEDYINHSLYFEAKSFLHGLLVVEDKLSMAHSLENRVPFLDNDLVDFALKLPVKTKLGNLGEVIRINENAPGPKTKQFFEKTNDGKLILRQVMKRYIPEKITSAVKQGFSAPDASWFRGESIDYVQNTLYNPQARIFDFLDKKTILEMVNEHLTGQTNRRLLIWSLLNLEEWCQTFL